MKKHEKLYLAIQTKKVRGKDVDMFVLDTHDKPRIYVSLDMLKKHNPNCSRAVSYVIEEEIKLK